MSLNPSFDALPDEVRLEILAQSRLLLTFGPQVGRGWTR